MRRESPPSPPPGVLFEWKRIENSFVLTRESDTVFSTIAVGTMSEATMDGLIRTLDQLVASGCRDMIFFHDWHAMESYPPATRQRLTDWRRNAPKHTTRAVHILVQNSFVSMGVAASAALLRVVGVDLTIYTRRPAFEHARAASR